MGLSDSLAGYKKLYWIKIKMSPTFLKLNTKIQGYTKWAFLAFGLALLLTTNIIYQNLDNNKKYDFLLKIFKSLTK